MVFIDEGKFFGCLSRKEFSKVAPQVWNVKRVSKNVYDFDGMMTQEVDLGKVHMFEWSIGKKKCRAFPIGAVCLLSNQEFGNTLRETLKMYSGEGDVEVEAVKWYDVFMEDLYGFVELGAELWLIPVFRKKELFDVYIVVVPGDCRFIGRLERDVVYIPLFEKEIKKENYLMVLPAPSALLL
jgi:hypothetical protein